jgi:tetratricopeptide (TPR) repeat protein
LAEKSKLFARLSNDRVRLAELAVQEGKKDKAIELYAKAGEFAPAARLAAEVGDRRAAVRLYLQAALGHVPEGYDDAEPRQAGELLARAGHHREALELFDLGQAFRPAAESALKLQQFSRAARLYERAKGWAEAATYYERSGMIPDTLRVLEQESRRLAQEGQLRPAAAAAQQEVDVRRAELLVRLGRQDEAARLLQAAGPNLRAARMLETAGRCEEAIEVYLRLGEPAEAVRLLPKAPGLDRRRLAEVYRAAGRHAEAGDTFAALGAARDAAASYEAGGVWAKAGSRWEAAGEHLKAAGAYQRVERFQDAARCFAAAGEMQLAAAARARAGDRSGAATTLLKAGQPIDAARELLAAGDRAGAAKALFQVHPGSPRAEEAALLLAPLLVEERLFDDALRRLRSLPPVADGLVPAAGGLERLYWEARALAGLGQAREARLCFERLLAAKPGFRDAVDRLAQLAAPAAPPPVAAPPSPPVAPAAPLPDPGTTLDATRIEVPQQRGVADFADLEVGRCLAGRYDLLAELGRGGMGRVYKAHDRELGEEVAVKTLLTRGDAGDEERLLREVQICRRITHPNVVRVYDLGRFPGGIFVTMELLEGTRLDELIDPARPLPFERIRGLLGEIAAGLHEAHGLGIIHRDLKPGNVMVTPKRLKILDFGIARMAGFDTRLTQTGFAVGSPMYMSPEQLQGEEVDGRADLYALGVLAYALIAGREPFTGGTPATLALQHLQNPPPDPRRFRPDIPAPWLAFLAKLLAKNPAQRHASAAEVLAHLGTLPA